jgi:hypothetical protein
MTGDGSEHDAKRRAAAWSLLASGLEPLAPPAELRERLLQSLRGPERFTPFAPDIARGFGLTADAVRAALQRIVEPDVWQPAILPGSWFTATDALRQARTVISRLPAGTRIPMHRHAGRELTYVLDGELLEDGVKQLGPGDLLEMNAGSRHALDVAESGECLVVFSLRID